jgi:hypothetical protein
MAAMVVNSVMLTPNWFSPPVAGAARKERLVKVRRAVERRRKRKIKGLA